MPPIVEHSAADALPARLKRTAGETWAWMTGKWRSCFSVPPRPPGPGKRASVSNRWHALLQSILQIVVWLAFGAFLLASLPHVAYFFAAFEPQDVQGHVSDYWWSVAYALAIGIDMTSFLLSLNVALKMRRVTAGLSWYQKMFPAMRVFLAHWPFILLLVGFSWLVNFEHAKQFHSSMLSVAEQVQINLLLWQGKVGDLNPVIASAFPVLAVTYTGMADRIGDDRWETHKRHVCA